MTIDELIQKKESETAEFKENFGTDAIETAVAFANTKGGIILLGVSNDGDIRGTHIGKESLADWANRISQSTEPSIIPELEVVEDRNVVIIKISEFPIKPVATRGRCYRRVGNSNRVMTPQEVAQMHLQSTGGSWDLYPATDTTIEDLNLEAVKQYIKTANSTGRRKIGDEEPLQVLEKLELIKEGQPTWAASLLFGIKPQRHLSQAKTHCGRFKSETVVVDERMVEGTIIEQIEESMDFIRKNINVGLVPSSSTALSLVATNKGSGMLRGLFFMANTF